MFYMSRNVHTLSPITTVCYVHTIHTLFINKSEIFHFPSVFFMSLFYQYNILPTQNSAKCEIVGIVAKGGPIILVFYTLSLMLENFRFSFCFFLRIKRLTPLIYIVLTKHKFLERNLNELSTGEENVSSGLLNLTVFFMLN